MGRRRRRKRVNDPFSKKIIAIIAELLGKRIRKWKFR